MVHDCAITESQVVVLDLPVTFDLDAAMSGTRTLPYSWNPDYGARVGLLPRDATSGDATRVVRRRPLLRVPPAQRVRPARTVGSCATSCATRRCSTPTATVRTKARRALVRWTIDPAAGPCARGRASTTAGRSSRATTSASSAGATATATPLRSATGSSTGRLLKHDLEAADERDARVRPGSRHARAGVRAARTTTRPRTTAGSCRTSTTRRPTRATS